MSSRWDRKVGGFEIEAFCRHCVDKLRGGRWMQVGSGGCYASVVPGLLGKIERVPESKVVAENGQASITNFLADAVFGGVD